MGTWGVGPFANDSALDFLEEMATLPEEDREDAVQKVIVLAASDPTAIMREVVPEEVIAAAALVASALPSGNQLPWQHEEGARAAALPGLLNAELPSLALLAVEHVTTPDGWWIRSWTNPTDRAAAEDVISILCRVLRNG